MAEENNPKIILTDDDQTLIKAEDFVQIYSNNVQLQIGLWDARLTFGMIGDTEADHPVIEQKVAINLSKDLLKLLTMILGNNIKLYEAQFGEITLPRPQNHEAENIKVVTTKQPRAKKKS